MEIVPVTVVMVAQWLKNDARCNMLRRHTVVVFGYVPSGGRAAAVSMVMVGEEKN